jgi:hypothetical protein
MASTYNVLYRNDRGVTDMISGGPVRGEHAGDRVRFVERGEPLYVCERVRVGAELRWKLEDDSNLCGMKTW